MVFPQVIAGFHALFDVIGLPGNLLVIVTIVLERRFHIMRYILLASLAVSVFLFLILVNSFRIASIAHERWLYGEAMCHLNQYFGKYFYINTVLHLLTVSYDRYNAIVRSPLTYDGTMTKYKVLFIVLMWVVPIPLCIGPFLGSVGRYEYNPEVFFCQLRRSVQSGEWNVQMAVVIASFVVPFLVILFLNWSVYKATKAQANALEVQVGSIDGSESQQQEISRQRSERKAAVDVSIIVAAFLLCYLPVFIVSFFHWFLRSIDVPSELTLITTCNFIVSSLCNPIIYSIRKRDFRAGVKKVFKRIFASSSDIDINVTIAMNNLRFSANIADTEVFTSAPAAALSSHKQGERSLPGSNENSGRVNFQRICLPEIPETEEEHD